MQALITCDESVAHVWRDFEEQQQRLVSRIAALRQRLTNFRETPVAFEILRRIEAHELIRTDLESKIRAEQKHIRWRTSALTDARASMEIARRMKESERRLQSLTELNASAVILEKARYLIWHCAAPIAELETALAPRELEARYCQQEIENLKEEYRAAKRELKLEIGTTERELVQITDRRNEMLRTHTLVHPGNALRDLVPGEELTSRSPPPAPNPKKRRRVSSVGTEAEQRAPEPPAAADLRLWTLVYTNDPPTREYPIARRWRQAVSTLGALLLNQRLAVSPALLLTKLTEVTHLRVQRRQGLKCVLGQDLHGWKILRVGEYRALLDINEEKRIIRFLVRPRKASYGR